eukprot:403332338
MSDSQNDITQNYHHPHISSGIDVLSQNKYATPVLHTKQSKLQLIDLIFKGSGDLQSKRQNYHAEDSQIQGFSTTSKLATNLQNGLNKQDTQEQYNAKQITEPQSKKLKSQRTNSNSRMQVDQIQQDIKDLKEGQVTIPLQMKGNVIMMQGMNRALVQNSQSKHQKIKYQNSEVLNRIAIEDVDKLQYSSVKVSQVHHKNQRSSGDQQHLQQSSKSLMASTNSLSSLNIAAYPTTGSIINLNYDNLVDQEGMQYGSYTQQYLNTEVDSNNPNALDYNMLKNVMSSSNSNLQNMNLYQTQNTQQRSGSRIANKKIANNSVRRNFPADFFNRRNNDSRCTSSQRLNSQESEKHQHQRLTNSSNKQQQLNDQYESDSEQQKMFQSSKYFQQQQLTSTKKSSTNQESNSKLPMIGRNQSAPVLQTINQMSVQSSQNFQNINLSNQKQSNAVQSQQQSTKKRSVKKLKNSVLSQDKNRYTTSNIQQTELQSPLLNEMHKMKQNCDKIIFDKNQLNDSNEQTIDDESPKIKGLKSQERRKMSQPDRPSPLRESMTKHYDEYRIKAMKSSTINSQTINLKQRKLPSILPPMNITQQNSIDQNRQQSQKQRHLSPASQIKNNKFDNSLESSSNLVPVTNNYKKQNPQQVVYNVNNGPQHNNINQINIIPSTPFFDPMKQSAESIVSLMSNGTIGSINIQNVQSIHIHNNVNTSSMQLNPNQFSQIKNIYQPNQQMHAQSMQNLNLNQQQFEPASQNHKPQIKHQRYQKESQGIDKPIQRSRSKDQQHTVQNRIQLEIKQQLSQQQPDTPALNHVKKIKKSLITVPGNQEEVIQRINSNIQQQEAKQGSQKSEEGQIIYLSQLNILHEKRQELSTPQFNEPRQTLKSFNNSKIDSNSYNKNDRSPQSNNPFEFASQNDNSDKQSPSQNSSGFLGLLQQNQKQGNMLERKDFLKRIQSQQAFFGNSNNESSSQEQKSSQGSQRPSHLSQQTANLNNIFGLDRHASEKKKLLGKKKKVVLMHQLNSVNNSNNASGLNSTKNSNRPSKASNQDIGRQMSHGVGDSLFDKAASILQQYNSANPNNINTSELPPKPNVTFCNIKQNQE